MSQFTCISCRVAFENGEIQRQHYKSDWHRYNLKRKVAELPSVTAEEFQRRVLQQQKDNSTEKLKLHCNACNKNFTNEKAFENHINSKKHKDNEKQLSDTEDVVKRLDSPKEAKIEEDSDLEEVDSDEWDDDTENPIDNNDCLFCSHHSSSIVKNVKHMTVAHSFFVPDVEYCIDLKGLLEYLGEKIIKGFMCIWCNEKGKSFHSAEAARKHMIDKGHCKMVHEGLALAEYVDFYDYSSSYPDATEGVDKDEEVIIPELEGNDYQLVLPSGVVVGHRSLMRYYKQSIDPNRQVIVHRNAKKLHKVLAHYKALGWTASQQEAISKTARDIHYMKRMQAKLRTNLGIKANKLQKHYRPQVNF